MKPHRFAWLLIALSATCVLAEESDWKTQIRFEDGRPASLKRLPHAFPTYKAWTESEKARMLTALEKLHEKWPGLVRRVTAYRPLRMYRQPKAIRESLAALAVPGFNALLIADRAFQNAEPVGPDNLSKLDLMLAHEMVHLVDVAAVPSLTERDEWKAVVQPRIDRVAARLKALDPQLTIERANADQKRYREIVWAEGMPRIYACRNLMEALACQAERIVYPQIVADPEDAGFRVPEEVEAFLRQYVLNADFDADPVATDYAKGCVAMEEKRFAEALEALNSVVERGARSARVYRDRAGVLQSLNRRDEAIADLTQAIELGDDEAYRTRGDVYAELNQSQQALESFTAFINKHPEDEQGYEGRGREYARVKQHAQARDDFYQSLKLNPANYQCHQFLGVSYMEEGKYAEAIEHFTMAIDAEAKLGASASENSATVRSTLLRSFAWQMTNRPEKQVEDLTTLIALNAKDPTYFSLRAKAFLRLKKHAEAAEDFTSLIALQPDKPEHLFERGNIYRESGKYDEALADYAKYLEKNPKGVGSRFYRGEIHRLQGKLDEALVEYDAGLKVSPDNVYLYIGRGQTWSAKGDYDKTIADFDEALKLNPKDAFLCFSRGSAWSSKGNREKAIADYDEALRLNPKYTMAYVNRGMVRRQIGEYDKAIADYDEALRLSPKYAYAYYLRGFTNNDRKDYSQAIADFGEALRLDPTYKSAYINRGLAWSATGEHDKAIADYDEALRLDPTYLSAHVNRARAWNAKGEYEKAVAGYDEALRLDPKYAYAYFGRAYTNNKRKEYSKGLADLREAIRLDPNFADSRNNLAWLLATCPDAKLRDGREAVEQGKKACELSQEKNSDHLGTLAAAYAEAGDFENAVRWETKAIEVNSTGYDKADAEKRLELFRQKQPYRQEP